MHTTLHNVFHVVVLITIDKASDSKCILAPVVFLSLAVVGRVSAALTVQLIVDTHLHFLANAKCKIWTDLWLTTFKHYQRNVKIQQHQIRLCVVLQGRLLKLAC